MSALSSLDAFLDSPAQRDVTRVVRHALFTGRGLTLVFGDAAAAAELVGVLARTHPVRRIHTLLIETSPLRITSNPGAGAPAVRDVSDVPGATVAQLIRSALRQDPDVITSFTRVDEEPSREDRADEVDWEDDAAPLPLRCDKLGGWPAWEQGREWPEGDGWELLFQLVEGPPLVGGTRDGWDFDAAELVRGTPPRPVLEADSPRHFVSLLTREASAFLFRSADSTRLAFRWQTG